MLCLHGKKAAYSKRGELWLCNQRDSCHFSCREDEAFLYDKAIKEFLATNQARPMCCGVTPEASAERNYARLEVVKDITKTSFGRPFFKCSKYIDGCDYFEWGDEYIIPKPICKHGKPCKIRKVKKEGSNEGRNFLCCPEPREKSCKFFKWFETPEPVEVTADEDPLVNEKDRKKTYDELLQSGEISSVSDGLFSPVQKRKTDVTTSSGKMKSASECNGNDTTDCKKRKTLLHV